MNLNRFQLTLCELFHPRLHGIDKNSDPNILQHYIVIKSYSFEDFNDSEINFNFDTDTDADTNTDTNTDSDTDSSSEYEELNNINYNVIHLIDMLHEDIQVNRRVLVPRKHPIIRNYLNIMKMPSRIEITENIILCGGETVAIIKTIWIRIIQRKWKRVYRRYLWERYLRVLRFGARLDLERNPLLLRGLLNDILRL